MTLLYPFAGVALVMTGMAGLLLQPHLLRKIMAFNIMGSGIFLILVGLGQREGSPDPVSQAMVLTGIVVSVAATALALTLARRLLELTGEMQLPVPGEEAARTRPDD